MTTKNPIQPQAKPEPHAPALALAICSAIELHLCRWAFFYVLATYAAFVACDLAWWHIRWKDGSTIYDFAMVSIGLFWLGVIGLSKIALRIISSPNTSVCGPHPLISSENNQGANG